MITVLVTGAGGGVGQGIIKALKLISDLEIKIISADMSALATGLYSADVAYTIPAVSSQKYLNRLTDIFVHEKVQYYFPGTDVELRFCAENAQDFLQDYGVHVVVSPLSVIEIADDKYKTYEYLKNHNFSFPETTLGDDVDIEKIDFPVVVKPRVGCRSIGVSVVQNSGELQTRLLNESDLIVQEYIGPNNLEFTCTCVVINNTASEVLILRRDLRSGDTYRAEPIISQTISEYISKLSLALKIKGSCNFQLRLDSKGIPKLFEINSRFSGTTPFCAQLGFNPVEYYLKNIIGINYEYEIDFNSYVLRHWSEIIVKKEIINELDSKGKIKPTIINRSFL